MKKGKILIVVLIGLLMMTGLFFAGCDLKECPDGKDCIVQFVGTGSGLIVSGQNNRCSSEDCHTNKMKSATDGYRSEMTCGGCKI
jgi:hypothetical protein